MEDISNNRYSLIGTALSVITSFLALFLFIKRGYNEVNEGKFKAEFESEH